LKLIFSQFKYLLETKTNYEIEWIIDNIVSKLHDIIECNFVLNMFKTGRLDILEYTISAIEKHKSTIRFLNAPHPAFCRAFIGITSGCVELLEHLVPNIVSLCQNKTTENALYYDLSCLNLYCRLELTNLEMFKFCYENKIFEVVSYWTNFNELPDIVAYMKENNIQFDFYGYIKDAISFSDEYPVNELRSILEIMEIDINVLEPEDIIHFDRQEFIDYDVIQEETVGNVIYRTSRNGKFAIIVDKLLQLGITISRLAHFIHYIDNL